MFRIENKPILIAAMMLAPGLAGCKSAPAPAPAPTQLAVAKSTYPPRPTTAPPPFRVFHTTDNSITLVTDTNATDDQIAAILWQLHNAAHNNTFAALHIPQQLVDKRDPMVWFHIYRGPKCAQRKVHHRRTPLRPQLPRRRRLHPRQLLQQKPRRRRPPPRRRQTNRTLEPRRPTIRLSLIHYSLLTIH